MKTEPTSIENALAGDYTGRSISFFHPNSKGTGSAMRLEPRINRHGEDRYNCFFLEMAAQKSAPQRKPGESAYATFDWENKITVKLGFLDISEILMVLEGRAAKIGGQRSGLYHASGQGNTMIALIKQTDRDNYYLSLSRKRNGEAEATRIGIGLTEIEVTGLRCLLQTGLFFVTFPNALRHSAPRQRQEPMKKVA
jgi:hypothetical protein